MTHAVNMVGRKPFPRREGIARIRHPSGSWPAPRAGVD